MAQRHLGERHPFMVRVRVEAELEQAADEAGYRSVSRWLADLAYEASGHPELKHGPDKTKEDDGQLEMMISA